MSRHGWEFEIATFTWTPGVDTFTGSPGERHLPGPGEADAMDSAQLWTLIEPRC
jgi:hypothetical protein